MENNGITKKYRSYIVKQESGKGIFNMEINNYTGIIMIMAACILVLLAGAFKRKKEWIINFIFRTVTGTTAVFFLNGFLVSQGISIAIGINPITVLTSGILGFPGLAMLYGINLYKFL